MNTQEPIRWGILAPGNIARSFATALGVLPDARLVALTSIHILSGSRCDTNRAHRGTFFAARILAVIEWELISSREGSQLGTGEWL